jgi:hypothetical protein
MSYLPYIAASYTLGVVIPVAFALSAVLRTGRARRRLAAVGSRPHRRGTPS